MCAHVHVLDGILARCLLRAFGCPPFLPGSTDYLLGLVRKERGDKVRARAEQSKEEELKRERTSSGVSGGRPNTLVQLSALSGVHMDTCTHAQLLSSWGLSQNNNSSSHLFLAALSE